MPKHTILGHLIGIGIGLSPDCGRADQGQETSGQQIKGSYLSVHRQSLGIVYAAEPLPAVPGQKYYQKTGFDRMALSYFGRTMV
jgi:hypothetical protein